MGIASSWATGYPYRLINAGEIQNQGIEITLNTRPIQIGDFAWDLNFNFAKNSNKVKSWLTIWICSNLRRHHGLTCRSLQR